MTDPLFLDQLRHALSCHDVARHYGVRVRRAQGAQWQAHCFNDAAHAHGDRNPSLSLGPTHFQCFAAQCDLHGDVFDLIAALEGLEARREFAAVVQIASELAHLSPPRPRPGGPLGPLARPFSPLRGATTPGGRGSLTGSSRREAFGPLTPRCLRAEPR